ncbi:hypothetical protein PR202_gb23433 [Eleusine coracana subsp. coracana]|uniref:Protein kinase domain-containing protein n=1 Tax=Eleusine coracana subsp. coracana TaxID=191504 RepID=A0AAV5FIF0_ELECO|nr:hypothetical protein PR202_gb23433 [Eleusine coracana subsp. coracana]
MSIGEWIRGPAIGRGSSATVSLAVDHRTGAVFAVKSVADAARAEELRREHSILQDLDSPHVVRCLGLVDCDLFLEHAAGGSLADEIKRLGAGVEEGLIRSRARDVLLGLAHAHAAGVVHCDVKARNVLLAADGRAVLADFGCARRIGISGGKVMGGTPMFMAPEAARGDEQGPAADIWALGCTVVEMATGGGAPWWPRFADPMAAMQHVAVSGEAPQWPRCNTWRTRRTFWAGVSAGTHGSGGRRSSCSGTRSWPPLLATPTILSQLSLGRRSRSCPRRASSTKRCGTTPRRASLPARAQ